MARGSSSSATPHRLDARSEEGQAATITSRTERKLSVRRMTAVSGRSRRARATRLLPVPRRQKCAKRWTHRAAQLRLFWRLGCQSSQFRFGPHACCRLSLALDLPISSLPLWRILKPVRCRPVVCTHRPLLSKLEEARVTLGDVIAERQLALVTPNNQPRRYGTAGKTFRVHTPWVSCLRVPGPGAWGRP